MDRRTTSEHRHQPVAVGFARVHLPLPLAREQVCDRGHVLYVLEGELDTELRDGRTFKLKPGMSYQVSDFGDAAHRSSTKTGAKLFIVD